MLCALECRDQAIDHRHAEGPLEILEETVFDRAPEHDGLRRILVDRPPRLLHQEHLRALGVRLKLTHPHADGAHRRHEAAKAIRLDERLHLVDPFPFADNDGELVREISHDIQRCLGRTHDDRVSRDLARCEDGCIVEAPDDDRVKTALCGVSRDPDDAPGDQRFVCPVLQVVDRMPQIEGDHFDIGLGTLDRSEDGCDRLHRVGDADRIDVPDLDGTVRHHAPSFVVKNMASARGIRDRCALSLRTTPHELAQGHMREQPACLTSVVLVVLDDGYHEGCIRASGTGQPCRE